MPTTRQRGGRRLLLRGLVVVGGAIAGTAAAWLISSATASADTLPAAPVQLPSVSHVLPDQQQSAPDKPSVQQARAAVRQLTDPAKKALTPVAKPVANAVHDTAELLRDPAAQWQRATDDARRAWQRVSQGLHQATAGHQMLPIPGMGGDSASGVSEAGPSVHHPIDRAVAPSSAAPSTSLTAATIGQRHASGDRAASAPNTRQHSSPAHPRAPAPRHSDGMPGVVPGSSGGSNQAGNGSAGSGVATTSSAAVIPGTTFSLPSRHHVRQLHGEPGSQPGNTPD